MTVVVGHCVLAFVVCKSKCDCKCKRSPLARALQCLPVARCLHAMPAQQHSDAARRLRDTKHKLWVAPPTDVLAPSTRASMIVRKSRPRTRSSTTSIRALAERLHQTPTLLALELQRIASENSARVLLYIDQMEELFSLVDDASVQHAFLEAIACAADLHSARGPRGTLLRSDTAVRE